MVTVTIPICDIDIYNLRGELLILFPAYVGCLKVYILKISY